MMLMALTAAATANIIPKIVTDNSSPTQIAAAIIYLRNCCQHDAYYSLCYRCYTMYANYS